MKYSLECEVDSKLIIGNVMKVVEGTKEYVLTPDKDGFMVSIKIITKVHNPEKFYSKIEDGDEKVKAKITVEADKVVFDELISEFQYIESALAFTGNLRQIHWHKPRQEWIPETEEEKAKLKVFAVSLDRKYLDVPMILRKENFAKMIQGKSEFDCLTTLKSFYREGKNSFTQFKYISAFYNFYFIVENLFGGGKTKNKQIEDNFKSSVELRKTIEWVINTQIKTDKKHSENISKLLKELNLKNTSEDIIELLVRMRGRVHHYAGGSSLKQATPLNERDFESVAFLAIGVALMSILKEIVKINQRNSLKEGISHE